VLDNRAFVHDEDDIRAADGREAMSDHDGGLAFHQTIQGFEDEFLRGGVESGGRLVEHKDRRVADDGAGDGNTLALASGERHAALANNGVQALGQLLDELHGVGKLGGALDLLAGSIRLAVGDVLPEGPVEEHALLQDVADLLAKRLLLEAPDVDAVDANNAIARIVETWHETDDGGFADAGGTDQGRDLAGLDAERHVLDDLLAGSIAKRHVVELDLALELLDGFCAGQVAHFVVGLQNFLDALVTDGRFRVGVGHFGKLLHGLVHLAQVLNEQDHGADGESTAESHFRTEPKDQTGSGCHDDVDQRRELGFQTARLQRGFHFV